MIENTVYVEYQTGSKPMTRTLDFLEARLSNLSTVRIVVIPEPDNLTVVLGAFTEGNTAKYRVRVRKAEAVRLILQALEAYLRSTHVIRNQVSYLDSREKIALSSGEVRLRLENLHAGEIIIQDEEKEYPLEVSILEDYAPKHEAQDFGKGHLFRDENGQWWFYSPDAGKIKCLADDTGEDGGYYAYSKSEAKKILILGGYAKKIVQADLEDF